VGPAASLLVALLGVHRANGFFITNNGDGQALTLAVVSLVLSIVGLASYRWIASSPT